MGMLALLLACLLLAAPAMAVETTAHVRRLCRRCKDCFLQP